MRKRMKKRICLGVFGFLLLMIFQIPAMAADWKAESCTVSGNVITLTEDSSREVGGYLKTAAIDTRNGFTLSFEYCVSDGEYSYLSGPGEGFQFILADKPVTLGNYGDDLGYSDYYYDNAKFYGFEMRKNESFATVTSSGKSKIYLTKESVTTKEDVWYTVKAVYQNKKLMIYRNGELILTCNQFNPPAVSYVGFTASTRYDMAWQKHQIRNVSIICKDANRVNLNLNGGTCKESCVYAIPNINNSFPVPERTGYTFKGWYTAASGGTKIINGNYNFASVSTVYAQWTPNTYKITLNPNGGTCSKSEVTVSFGSSYQILPTPKKTGYTFEGWYTTALSGEKVTNKNIVDKANDQTLYAHWKIKTYKVTFHPNKGTLSKSKQIKYADYYEYIWTSEFPTPKRKNYTFLGWYTKKSGGKKIESSQKITSNRTYYAHWVKSSKKVKVKLNANKGSSSKKSLTVTYGGKMKGLPKATRKGYTFQGWYTKKSGGTKISASTKTVSFITETKTLYAHWSKKSSGSSSASSSSSGNKNKQNCIMCNGSGRCQKCGGDGYRWSYALGSERLNCYGCNTSGRCSYCGGSGKR